MKSEIKYIELKSNYSHNGPAWIGLVFFSKTGKTIYFNGKAFQRIGSSRIRGNFYDIETMEEYWISGVKKSALDAGLPLGGSGLQTRVTYRPVVARSALNCSQR